MQTLWGSPAVLEEPTGLQKAVVQLSVLLKEDGGGVVDLVELSPRMSEHFRLILKFYIGCTLSWSCRQHNVPQGHRWWVTRGEGEHGSSACAAPHATAELCWPHPSSKWGNLVVAINYVASPRGCSSSAEPLPPRSECQNATPSPWVYAQADAVAVCPLGASPVGEILREADKPC